MGFDLLIAAAGVAAGAIASVAGFGIGSLLTPIFALHTGTRLAVAAVAIPHLAGTALRFWMLRGRLDRRVFVWFGLTSAAGGLAGALLHASASNGALARVFGGLLIFVGLTELTGLMSRVRLGKKAAWIAGGLSGFLGGLVGNQGGIRSAALLSFDLNKEAFVATATAVGLIIDGARLPVYVVAERDGLLMLSKEIAIAAVAVIAGTVLGMRLLQRVPPTAFRRIVAVLLLALAGWMLIRAAG